MAITLKTPEDCRQAIFTALDEIERIDYWMKDAKTEEDRKRLRSARWRCNQRLLNIKGQLTELTKLRRFEEQVMLQKAGVERRERNIAAANSHSTLLVQALRKYVTDEQFRAAALEVLAQQGRDETWILGPGEV